MRAAAKLTTTQWEWQDDQTQWTPFLEADRSTIERLYQRSNGECVETADLSWNKGYNTTYRYDFRVMEQVNTESDKRRRLRRREVPCCPKGHTMKREEKTSKAGSPNPSEHVVCSVCSIPITPRGEAYHHCAACPYVRCLSCQGEKVAVRSFAKLADWHSHFRALSLKQVDTLRRDVAVRAQLERDGLEVVWRQWVDTERSFRSEDGKTTTDLTLFAMGPERLRRRGQPQKDSDFVNFPAVRSPNYSDEVDVVGSTDEIRFDVKNRYGELVKGITLRRFLETLGQFIKGFEPSARWSDPIDATPLQTSSQFSIIPAPSGRADVGIAAFGHQCTNLHIVIGPAGDIGWAKECPGAQRIFFRDDSGNKNHAISLVPENREEVSNAFFKLETHDETVEEEKQRYEKVQNRLMHLQITMDGVVEQQGAKGRWGRGNQCPNGHELQAFFTPHAGFCCDACSRPFPHGAKMFGCRQCDFDHCAECWRKFAPKGTAEPAVAVAAAAPAIQYEKFALGGGRQSSGSLQEVGSAEAAMWQTRPVPACSAPVSACSVDPAMFGGGYACMAAAPRSVALGLAAAPRMATSASKPVKASFRAAAPLSERVPAMAARRSSGVTAKVASGSSDSDGAAAAPRTEEEDQLERETLESGLLLAVVERGAEVGSVAEHQRVPRGARRKPGVPVRVTYMHYGLAADGNISAERTRRFALQANFRRRELGLPHGSLVTGLGSWGGPENAPIKLFGFRLTDALEGQCALEVIEGVSQVPMPGSLSEACQPLSSVVSGALGAAQHAEKAAGALMNGQTPATKDQVAAFFLYTMEHNFYRQLNAAMRDEDRSKAAPFFHYLKLLFSGLEALSASSGRLTQKPKELWRGVHRDLLEDHPKGSEITWWGASSCTPKLSVAEGFLGCEGPRTLFTVRHLSGVPIRDYSAFRGEEEWLLAPGTRLHVDDVVNWGRGLTKITVSELPPPRNIR